MGQCGSGTVGQSRASYQDRCRDEIVLEFADQRLGELRIVDVVGRTNQLVVPRKHRVVIRARRTERDSDSGSKNGWPGCASSIETPPSGITTV